MKARFSTQQNAVTTVLDGNTLYCQIALNEMPVEIKEEESSETYIEYEYDFNSFTCQQDEIDMDDLNENPDLYLDYPSPVPTEDERLTALEEAVIALMGV